MEEGESALLGRFIGVVEKFLIDGGKSISVQPINDKFQVSIFLDNDVNAAAIGEYMVGAGRGSENIVFVIVSTGGGVYKAGEVVFDKVREVVKKTCLAMLAENTKIFTAELGIYTGVIGDAALTIV